VEIKPINHQTGRELYLERFSQEGNCEIGFPVLPFSTDSSICPIPSQPVQICPQPVYRFDKLEPFVNKTFPFFVLLGQNIKVLLGRIRVIFLAGAASKCMNLHYSTLYQCCGSEFESFGWIRIRKKVGFGSRHCCRQNKKFYEKSQTKHLKEKILIFLLENFFLWRTGSRTHIGMQAIRGTI
jgi:hypothetical protein